MHAPNRFQFTLQDMIFVSGLTFFGIVCFMPVVGYTFMTTDMTGKPISNIGAFVCASTIFLTTLFGAWIGICRARNASRTGMRRLLTIATFTPGGWALLVFFLPPLTTHRGFANQRVAEAACRAYAEAQEIYQRNDWDNDGIREYATSLKQLAASERGCFRLICNTMVGAEGEPGKVPPKAGYVFKVMTRQGSSAPGGARSYISPDENGVHRMNRGYALAACPAEYKMSGQNIYIISRDGRIYWKDFGEQTHGAFAEMTEFNPDNTWTAEFDPYGWSSPE